MHRAQGNLWVKGSVCFVLIFALPHFSPPLPSGVQISKQNRHRTFYTRISYTGVYNFRRRPTETCGASVDPPLFIVSPERSLSHFHRIGSGFFQERFVRRRRRWGREICARCVPDGVKLPRSKRGARFSHRIDYDRSR